jgi:hypothetical protein
MANKIQIRRGLRADLPILSIGEFGLCTDTGQIFIGTATGNVEIANMNHTHDFTHDHDERYYLQSTIDSLLSGKSDTGHKHTKTEITDFTHQHTESDISDLDKYTKAEVDNALANKANTSDVNTALASKADKSTVEGHIGNSTIHVTATDKSNWNAKADVEDIPTKTSQLQNDSGFITEEDMPEGFSMSIGASHNNADVWLKVI